MPRWADQGRTPDAGPWRRAPDSGQRLAVLAESLYLANLLVLPGLAFAALVWLCVRRLPTAPPLARAHLAQALSASLWAGSLLVAVSLVILALGGWSGMHAWVIVILYFVLVHTSLVLLGILALSKALAGQTWRMPLVSRFPLVPNDGTGRQ